MRFGAWSGSGSAAAGPPDNTSPPTISGTLFVGSAGGAVQALDASTGCIHWIYQATGPVRAAMTVAPNGAQHVLVFSDQNGSVYALDARTGREQWKKRVEEHEATRLTASLTDCHGGTLSSCSLVTRLTSAIAL